MESKYRHLYKQLLEKIDRREYRPGDRLPPEGELMEACGASRDTVRKALELLVRDGYIRKARGKAAEVLDKNKINFPVSEIASFKEIYRFSDLKPRTFVENLEIVKNDPKLMEALQIGPEDEAFLLERVREIEGEKIIIDKDYFSRRIVENLPLRAAQDSVYEYLEKEAGLKIGFAMKEITVHMAADEDYRLLDMGSYDMVVVVKSYTYLEDSTLFQYTESRHRPDKFKFVDFARRKL
ncbi:trehalose operon repressor [Lachnospiraceae bacterium 54-53]